MKSKPAGISEKVIRLLEIYTMIAQKQYPSVPFLKEHFHVSERSVYRYLEIINMIDGIEFDQERKGYAFTNGDRIKKLSLSDNELLVLFAASEAVSHLGESLGHGFQELMNRMTAATKKAGAGARIPIAVKMPEAVGNEQMSNYFASCRPVLNERRSIELVYRAQATKEVTNRLVDPYGLVFYDGTWTMIGYCHLRKEIRSFALDRIIDLKERYLYFKPQDDFNLDEYLSHSWGIVDDEEVRVKVRFSGESGRLRAPQEVAPFRTAIDAPRRQRGAYLYGRGHRRDQALDLLLAAATPRSSNLCWFREQAAAELSEAGKRHGNEADEGLPVPGT